MSTKGAFSIKALVLKKIPYGEDDLIVHFLTEEGTRLNAFASSARKSAKRFGGSLDLFNELDIICREAKGDLARLDSADLICLKEGIRRDLSKFAAACYFTEVILAFLQEKESHPALYKSFHRFLNDLNRPEPMADEVLPLMEHHFLDLFGFKPTLNRCLVCGCGLEPDGIYYFEGGRGGIVCAPCTKGREFPLTYGSISRILKDHAGAWKPQEISQTRKAFEYFIQYTAGRPLKSLQFLKVLA